MTEVNTVACSDELTHRCEPVSCSSRSSNSRGSGCWKEDEKAIYCVETGPVCNNITGPVCNNMTGPVCNNMTGPVCNNMTGPVYNNMTGPVCNNMTGPVLMY